jgi:thiol-disulfide isomerase/thioredoxin
MRIRNILLSALALGILVGTAGAAAPLATPLEAGDAAQGLVGKAAPNFTLKQLGGKDVTLKDLKGQVVVLDFWATWCGPCVKGLPHVDAIYKDKKDKGMKAFAVNMQEDPAEVQKFIAEKKLSLPVLLETKGDVAAKYKVEAIPETVVIGKDGTVKKVFVGIGPDTEQQLHQAVEDALAAK